MEGKRKPRHRINAFGEKLTSVKGRFDKGEDDIILKSLAIGLKKRGMSVSEIGTKSRYDGLFREIAEQLPDRSVERVYDRAKILINPHKVGPWSNDEIYQLKESVKLGESWKSIEEKLNRSANNCRHQARRLNEINWDNYKLAEQFSDDELERLRQELISVLGMENKNATFLQIDNATRNSQKNDKMRGIPWSKIVLKFPGRSNAVLKKKYDELIVIDQAARKVKKEEIIYGSNKGTHIPQDTASDNKNNDDQKEEKQLFKGIKKKHCLDVMIIAVETSRQQKTRISDESSKLKRFNTQWPLAHNMLQMESVVETISSSQNVMDEAEKLNTTMATASLVETVPIRNNSIDNKKRLTAKSVENVHYTTKSNNTTNNMNLVKTIVNSENKPSTKKRKSERKYKKKKKSKRGSK